MTLIEFRGPGDKKRTCSARCYNAKGSKCGCVCGGKNHGVGLEAAVLNSHVLIKCLSEEDGATAYAVPYQLRFDHITNPELMSRRGHPSEKPEPSPRSNVNLRKEVTPRAPLRQAGTLPRE